MPTPNAQIAELLKMLDSDNQDDRLTAIETLGEIRDADALQVLHAHLKKQTQNSLC